MAVSHHWLLCTHYHTHLSYFNVWNLYLIIAVNFTYCIYSVNCHLSGQWSYQWLGARWSAVSVWQGPMPSWGWLLWPVTNSLPLLCNYYSPYFACTLITLIAVPAVTTAVNRCHALTLSDKRSASGDGPRRYSYGAITLFHKSLYEMPFL